ncbi:unnamed protein product [Effrenium voratum]|uniref:SGNH hydrolase-type esterase domain-containing protein n=1 Tax=Effrenium voratum TaxID=2562239 RepID=A0AA36MYG3_9DINO|nr:unnamed protein product [Effrenium voratum]
MNVAMLQRLLRCGSAEVVLVLGGTNDVLGLGHTEDWKQASLAATLANLRAMHELAAARGALVGVLALPVFQNAVGCCALREMLNAKLAAMQASYSRAVAAMLAREIWKARARRSSRMLEKHQCPDSGRHLYDGLHFGSEGYFHFARLLAEALRGSDALAL